MKARRYIFILIGILLILNAAAFGWLFRGIVENNKQAIEETVQSPVQPGREDIENKTETDRAEELSENDANIEDGGEETNKQALIAVVDYDTEDAERILRYLNEAGCNAERVGTLEKLNTEKYDGIIIPGGHSVTPSMYGAERQPETKDTDIEKDRFQFGAVEMFVEAEKPVLGICRGEQLVNNVLGGTTIQHMEDGWHKKDRTVRIAEGTWLYDMFGTEALTYHYHHQCVDRLGEGLYATQWDAESGCIEAYEHKTLPVYGLQWHPDSMEEQGVEVFRAFGEIVNKNMK